VAALFIYALCVATLGFPRSQFAASLAWVLLMLPGDRAGYEEMLRIVPMDLRSQLRAGHHKMENHCQSGDSTGLSGIITGSCWRWLER